MIGKQNISLLIDMNHKKITKKANTPTAVAKINERQYVAALQEIPIKSLTRNENPLKS